MKLIEELSELIEEEIEDGDKYIKCALNYKDSKPDLAQMFFELSQDEIKHVGMIHDQVARLIEQYKAEKGEPPAEMAAVYKYLHERHIKQAGGVKMLQSAFR